MPINSNTPEAAIQRAIDRRLNQLLANCVEVLQYVGEQVLGYARDPGRRRYQDQTGNLTSSIGYVVLMDGKVMHESDFVQLQPKQGVKPGKVSGSSQGRKFLKRVAQENGEGLALIMVAGMPYAAYVEAMGLDVLDSAEIKAEELVRKMIRKLKF